MKKILGIFGLLVFICIATTLFNPLFVSQSNIENNLRWTALFSIIGIGVSLVIITGGIDLSIGSVIGLTGCMLPLLLASEYVPSGERVTVQNVAAQKRQFSFEQRLDLREGDRLLFEKPGVGLTVDHASSENGVLSVIVRESPKFLDGGGDPDEDKSEAKATYFVESGDEATITYFEYNSIPGSLAIVALVSVVIGLTHGLLITKLRLQPFIVTLCGLLFYRGLARFLTGNRSVGFGVEFHDLKYLASGKPIAVPLPLVGWISEGESSFVAWINVPMPVIIMIIIAIGAAVYLNLTVYGRYLLALGNNETAARYSGVNTDRIVILAYVFCSLMAGLAGVLFALDFNSAQASTTGSWYELYAIAAAVLGGCSLRGGQGSVLGVIIGTAVLVVLRNAILMWGFDTDIEFAIIGLVILAGVIVDELVKRYAARRRARRSAAAAEAAAA